MSNQASGWVSASDFSDDDMPDTENADIGNSSVDWKRESSLRSFERSQKRLSQRMRELIDDPLQKDAELIHKKWEREDELKDREAAELEKCSFKPTINTHYKTGKIQIRPRPLPERTVPDDEKEWEWIRIEANPPKQKKYLRSFMEKTKVDVVDRANIKRRPKIEKRQKIKRSADPTEFYERDERLCKRRLKYEERLKKPEPKQLSLAQLRSMSHHALTKELDELYRRSVKVHRGGEVDDEIEQPKKETSSLTYVRLALPKGCQVPPPPAAQQFDHSTFCFSQKSKDMTRGALSLFDREVYDFDDLLEEYRILHNMS